MISCNQTSKIFRDAAEERTYLSFKVLSFVVDGNHYAMLHSPTSQIVARADSIESSMLV